MWKRNNNFKNRIMNQEEQGLGHTDKYALTNSTNGNIDRHAVPDAIPENREARSLQISSEVEDVINPELANLKRQEALFMSHIKPERFSIENALETLPDGDKIYSLLVRLLSPERYKKIIDSGKNLRDVIESELIPYASSDDIKNVMELLDSPEIFNEMERRAQVINKFFHGDNGLFVGIPENTILSDKVLESKYLQPIRGLVEKGGPDKEDDSMLMELMNNLFQDIKNGVVSEDQCIEIYATFGLLLSMNTSWGQSLFRIKNYAGAGYLMQFVYDYYDHGYIPGKEGSKKMNEHMLRTLSARDVYLRKEHIKELIIQAILKRKNNDTKITNFAGGPGQLELDLLKTMEKYDMDISKLQLNSVDSDKDIGDFASQRHDWPENVTFSTNSIGRFILKPDSIIDLCDILVCIGLSDYLTKETLIKALIGFLMVVVKDGGMIIWGNFKLHHSDEAMMSMFNWDLFTRTKADLEVIAKQAVGQSDINPANVKIEVQSVGDGQGPQYVVVIQLLSE